MLLASGISPDGLFGGSISLVTGLGAIILSIFLSVRDRKAVRSDASREASETQKRFDELTALYNAVQAAQLKRVDAMWSQRFDDAKSRIAELTDEVRSLRGDHG